jgi:hypothetical protein
MFSEDPELSRIVSFDVEEKACVHEKACNDKSVLEKIQEYQGPDPDTRKMLSDNHHHWAQNPSTFWMLSSPVATDLTNPQVEIVGRYLQNNSSDT